MFELTIIDSLWGAACLFTLWPGLQISRTGVKYQMSSKLYFLIHDLDALIHVLNLLGTLGDRWAILFWARWVIDGRSFSGHAG